MAKTSLRRSPHLFTRPTASRIRLGAFLPPHAARIARTAMGLVRADVGRDRRRDGRRGRPAARRAGRVRRSTATALSYAVSTTNSSLTATVHEGNRSLRIVVPGYGDMVFELFEDLAPRRPPGSSNWPRPASTTA